MAFPVVYVLVRIELRGFLGFFSYYYLAMHWNESTINVFIRVEAAFSFLLSATGEEGEGGN